MIRSTSHCVILLIVTGLPLAAAATPRAVPWPADIAERVPGAQLDTDGALSVMAPEGADLSLIEIDSPGISQPFFGFRTRIRHNQVIPAGWIQMDVAFTSGEVYFSRQPLDGDGPWRALELPFNASEPGGAWRSPSRLGLRVILPGGGQVGLAPLEVFQAGSAGALARASGAWWSAAEAGWIGAIGGTVFGALGALVGILVGRARARGVALTLCWLASALAGVAAIAGLIALAQGQGYAVYYPLLLLGALGIVLFPLFAMRSRRAYAADELRRMRARDAGQH